MSSKISDLNSLRIYDVVSIVKLLINELSIVDVDEWTKVDGRDADEGEAPQRNNLDEPIWDECC